MPDSQSVAQRRTGAGLLVLGVDTCGPSGSVALARIEEEKATVLGQKELPGRTYSATLVKTVGEILADAGTELRQVDAFVAVSGPGSFTGVRVGLSAVKGLAEPRQIPVVAVSRLEVLAVKAGVGGAALDAHRHEVFLRIKGADGAAREQLAGAEEIASLATPDQGIAVCEETAGAILKQSWPGVGLVRTTAPTAADAIELCMPRILSRDFADLALLDGHYLRRSDAEIFGDSQKASEDPGKGIRVRRMRTEDIEGVMQLAGATQHAPGWTLQAYEKATDAASQPRRVALVAEQARAAGLVGFVVAGLIPAAAVASVAELETIVTAPAHQRRGVARELFSSLKNELRRLGVREVILEVRAGNGAAHGFYRYLGFAEEGRRPAYYADPVEDAILMRLPIA